MDLNTIIEIGTTNERDQYFHWVFPETRKDVLNFIDSASIAELELIHEEILNYIEETTGIKKNKKDLFLELISFACQNSVYHFLTTVCANIRVELDIRSTFQFLTNQDAASNVEYYEKENWGKCILFDYKGKKLLASTGREFYKHNPTEYSLYRAYPRFK